MEVVLSHQSAIKATNSHEIQLGSIYLPYTEGARQVKQGVAALSDTIKSVQQTADGAASKTSVGTDEGIDTLAVSPSGDATPVDQTNPVDEAVEDDQQAGVEGDEVAQAIDTGHSDMLQQRSASTGDINPAEFVSGVQKQLNAISAIVNGGDAATQSPQPSATPQATPSPKPTPSPSPTLAPSATPEPEQASVPSQIISQGIDHEEQDIDDDSSRVLDIIAIPPAPTPSTEDPAATQIEAMIAVALEQVGKPYVRGGKGPSNFDCSGFVFYALNQSGYNIDYMTSGSWAKSGFTTINSIDQMQRGDIICLRGHVAIYLGDGIMVDASSSNRKIVVRDVGGWCRRNFISAKRVFNIESAAPKQDDTQNMPVVPKDVIEIN